MPIPYMLFTKGLKETIKMNVNPDTMNFLYVYAGYQYHQIQILILMDSGCLILCRKLYFGRDKIYNNYNYIMEIIFYFIAVKPIRMLWI
jgi:hypothetical protein